MIWLLLAYLALVPVTWMLYVVIMGLHRADAEGKLSPTMRRLGTWILEVGLVFDFLLNLLVGSVLFLELPREWLLSPRVARLQKGQGYRAAVAAWICKNLLDPFDPSGCHCK